MKVAINGFGRIGRLVFRVMEEDNDMDVVAINDLGVTEDLAYLLKYDSCQKSYEKDEVDFEEDYLVVKGKKIKVYSEADPSKLPWGDLGVDVVFECSGHFTDYDGAHKHIEAGAKKVVVSAPCKGDVKTIVYGVNEGILNGSEDVISAASCTTNCLAPILKVLDDEYGINMGYMTTVHAYTNDQNILDGAHKKGIKSRRGRAAALNIIPTSTGAATAIGKVIPSLDGKLKGDAMRVPIATGSSVDLVLKLNQKVDVDMLNNLFKKSANQSLGVTNDPIVSSDIIGSTHGGVVDLGLTDVLDADEQLVKVVAWYDNENGYSNQMVRTAKYFGGLK